MTEIITTAEGNAYLDERYDWFAHDRRLRVLRNRGWVRMPDWWPGGWPGYEYEILGGFDVMMKPKPSFSDTIKFKWLRRILRELP